MTRLLTILLFASAPILGGAIGCDRTVSESETVKTKSDGTVERKSTEVREKPDGTIVKEQTKSVDKP